MANITKPQFVLDLFVDSSHRVDGNNYDFKVPPTDSYSSTDEFVIAMKNAIISNYVYTISAGVNDLLKLRVFKVSTSSTVEYAVVFTEGYYNASSLTTTLQNLFTNVTGIAVEVDYDLANLKFVLQIPNDYIITFINTGTSSEQYRIVRCCEILGFTGWLEKPLNEGSSVAPQMVKLNGTSYVDVCVNLNTNSFNSQGSVHNVIQRIPMSVPFGECLMYENISNDQGQYIQGYAMQNLRIYLIDQWGEYFKVPDEGEVVFHFKLTPITDN
jgi:hypothetical protein